MANVSFVKNTLLLMKPLQVVSHKSVLKERFCQGMESASCAQITQDPLNHL